MSGALSSEINSAAQSYNLPASLIKAVATQESGLGSASSNIMQINGWNGGSAAQNITQGANMLATYYNKTGSVPWTLAMYNMGPGIYEWAQSKGITDPAQAMKQFSDYMKSTHGLSVYGDPNYIANVERYM